MKFLILLVTSMTIALSANLRVYNIKSFNVEDSKHATEGRIYHGQEAKVNQFPYHVGIYIKLNNSKAAMCSGSLIGKQWVLTAAHCADGIEYTVYLGTVIFRSAEVKYKIKNEDIITHHAYKPRTLENDIALIKIPVTNFTANIKPIKLPAISSFKQTYVGKKAIASGWGDTEASQKHLTKKLHWAKMNIVKNAVCSLYYGKAKTSVICTKTARNESVCPGDSGGPLVLHPAGLQVGVISSVGIGACDKGVPDIYTRLTSYLSWIWKHTGIIRKHEWQ